MPLFNRESKEEKQDRETQEFMERYQLEDLDEKDLAVLRRIAADLRGTGFFKAGLALSFKDPATQAQVRYQSTLVEQNWMIIRQLSRLNKNIEAQLNK
jgi:hypothetical protein